MLGDLSVVGSLAGGGELGHVDLVYVPEPASLGLFPFRTVSRSAEIWAHAFVALLVTARMRAAIHDSSRQSEETSSGGDVYFCGIEISEADVGTSTVRSDAQMRTVSARNVDMGSC